MAMDKQEQAIKAIDRLIKLGGGDAILQRAMAIRQRLKLPMTDVLAKVPGRTHTSKAKFLGVSRPSYYEWLNGKARPGKKMAAKLARVTGYDAAAIRGRA